jgi:hypothetical protein
VGGVLIYFTKNSIGETCHLTVQGERRWNKSKFNVDLCNQFLVPEHHDHDWNQGIFSKWIKEECQGILTMVQRYITGEGRYSYAYYYHIIFFMHLNGDAKMSLPFYLLKILTKMANRV